MADTSHRVSAVLGLRLLQSFSAMRVTLSYLTPYEQLCSQHFCAWFYMYGTSRVQIKIILNRNYLFTGFQ